MNLHELELTFNFLCIGEDYRLLASTELNFPPNEERMPFGVQFLDDQLPEEVETFELELVTEDDHTNISFSLSTTSVNIIDNDGEKYMCLLYT